MIQVQDMIKKLVDYKVDHDIHLNYWLIRCKASLAKRTSKVKVYWCIMYSRAELDDKNFVQQISIIVVLHFHW